MGQVHRRTGQAGGRDGGRVALGIIAGVVPTEGVVKSLAAAIVEELLKASHWVHTKRNGSLRAVWMTDAIAVVNRLSCRRARRKQGRGKKAGGR
jgi:hypothetical protein